MITLRDWRIEDAPELYAMSRDAAFIQSGLPSYESIREAEDSILWRQKAHLSPRRSWMPKAVR